MENSNPSPLKVKPLEGLAKNNIFIAQQMDLIHYSNATFNTDKNFPTPACLVHYFENKYRLFALNVIAYLCPEDFASYSLSKQLESQLVEDD